MKQRLISAAFGLTFIVIILVFYQTIALNITLSLGSMIGIYEMLRTTQLTKNIPFSILSLAFAGLIPFLKMQGVPDYRNLAVLVYVLLAFTIFLGTHNICSIQNLAVCMLATFGVPFALSNMIYLRDDFLEHGLYYLFMIFGLAWICDGGAYFIGRKFGKHKLAPQISPNKTIEGAIGGVATNLVFGFLITIIYCQICNLPWDSIQWLPLLCMMILCSFTGMLGDLSASIIKRQYHIKDFGNLIPGHGGIIDRVDSVLFVAPVVYMFVQAFKII